MQGLVIRNTGSHYTVLCDDGSETDCKVKGRFRLKGIRTTNPIAVGDHVTLSEDKLYISDIEPRRNYIIRRASNLSKESHIIAANVDQAMLVATLSHPETSTTFIDRFLATSEAYRVPAILVINKVDLLTDKADAELLDAVTHLYRSIGYTVIQTSAATGQGIDAIKSMLQNRVTLLSGNSGVGKSTIINAVIPGLNLRTAAISATHLTGMHTTTFSEMFRLPQGGWLIDTPGVRGFGTVAMEHNEVSHFFPEIFRISSDCRYSNCTHVHEPGCAVRNALDQSRISQSRYASYLSILADAADHEKYR